MDKLNKMLDSAGSLENPQWECAGEVHDWRNYIPPEAKECWSDLTHRERGLLYIMADAQAGAEEWD